MGRPTTRRSVSRKGRSKSPEKKASPAKTRSRTRSTRKSTKADSPKSKAKSATTVKPLKLDAKSPTVKKADKSVKKAGFALDTLWVSRIHYMQLFFIGVCAIAVPEMIASGLFAKGVAGAGFDLGMKWFGVALVAFSMQHMAAAQGTPAERKKSLQYGMMFWIMASALMISSNEQLKQKEFSLYGSAWVLTNMTLAIYACYYHVEAN